MRLHSVNFLRLKLPVIKRGSKLLKRQQIREVSNMFSAKHQQLGQKHTHTHTQRGSKLEDWSIEI